MDKTLKQSLTSQEKWLRFLFMVFFFVINYFVQMLVGFIALLQFIFTLFKGEPNERMLHFGDSVSQFVYQMMCYLTYTSQDKPFPFNEWPVSNGNYHNTSTAGHLNKPAKKAKDKESSHKEEE